MARNESLTCRDIQNLLAGGQFTREALGHAHQCEICLQFLLDRVMQTREDASAPPLFAQQVLANLPDSSECRPSSLKLALVLAASLLAVTLMIVFFSELTAFSLSFWGSALLLAVSVQGTFVILWLAGRTRF